MESSNRLKKRRRRGDYRTKQLVHKLVMKMNEITSKLIRQVTKD